MYLKMTKNEEVSVGDMFSKFNQTGRALWLFVLKNIYITLWSMLFVIPGIIKTYSYYMAEFILAENPELTANQAITKSKEMMKGHKFELFVLQLSFFWWFLLGGITFGLAYIYIVPYMGATFTNFYNSIKE